MAPKTIRVSESSIGAAEIDAVVKALESNRLSQGSTVSEFENVLAKYARAKYATACNSGTSALHLAMLAAGVGPGTLVIVPALTYVATANAATYCGAQIAVADVLPESWCIDPSSVGTIFRRWEKSHGGGTLVAPVDLYDALAMTTFIGDNGDELSVVLDASHSMRVLTPAEHDIAAMTYSFFPSKLITTGEGGAVITDQLAIQDSAVLYRGQGASTPGQYIHDVVGYNYRMTEVAAAIGRAQMAKIYTFIVTRALLTARYRFNLLAYPQVTVQEGTRASGWAMAVTTPVHASVLRQKLAKRNIETRRFFTPINQLPMYDHLRQDTPVAQRLFEHGLVLPMHVLMSTDDVDTVCEALIASLKETI